MQISDNDLLGVSKPAQYLGGELNSVLKDEPSVEVNVALAFPDVYEIGMSHLGLAILYDVLNEIPWVWAERAFMPFPDMSELLQKKGLVLSSLESKRKLHKFDVVGFSLQYELSCSNIIRMLQLGRIPCLAKDRTLEHPLVIGGGPWAFHPEAIADFFDVIFLGDAEEGIIEIVELLREKLRPEGDPVSRASLLEQLSSIEGVYIPSFYQPEFGENWQLKNLHFKPEVVSSECPARGPKKRLLATLEDKAYPKSPIVPNVNTVHNRLSVEVMRGCVRGCRFCQAGYLYRPQRERRPEEVLSIIDASLNNTGFEELSLLSLSTADYCSVVPLLSALMDNYSEPEASCENTEPHHVAISFPSTRVDALNSEILSQVQRVRRTGFTLAPEAGTQRLRDVINKGVSSEQILETSAAVFRLGWTGIKLYFMIGLPTETEDDLQGIIDTAKAISTLPEAKGKKITVSVSTFVPKPHTPFQWAAQLSPSDIKRHQAFLAAGLREVRISFRYQDAFSTFLEGVFCRGGRELSKVILRAVELGCELDAWSEHLSEDAWLQAFQEIGIEPEYYLRERALDECLPWDHLDCGIPKQYFQREYQRAIKERTTSDCLTGSCSLCELCDQDEVKNILFPAEETKSRFADNSALGDKSSGKRIEKTASDGANLHRVRICYEKTSWLRFLGHLEFQNLLQRAIRRASLPIAYSAGFHPMPKLAMGPPLALGVASMSEYADLYLERAVSAKQVKEALNAALLSGSIVKSAESIERSVASVQQSITGVRYRVEIESANAELHPKEIFDDLKISRSPQFRSSGKRGSRRPKRTKEKVFYLRDFVYEFELLSAKEPLSFEFSLKTKGGVAGPKPFEVIEALCQNSSGGYQVVKTDTFFAC